MNHNRKLSFLVVVLLINCFVGFSQTYNWTGFVTTTNSSTRTFVNGNMTAVVTAVSGGGTTGYSNGSSSQIGGSGVCSGTPTGLFLEMSGASSAWNNSINVAITFATPVCAPATFSIYDVNEAIWNDGTTNYSNYDDQITISATDPSTAAIAPANITYGGCAVAGNVSTAGNNKILRGRWTSNGCTCSNATVTINGGGQMIKTINILYNNVNPPTYAKYGICQYQNVVISPIVVAAPPTVSISAAAIPCGSSTTTLTATTSAGSPTYSWAGSGGTSIVSTAAASTSVTGVGTYTVTINPGGCSATATYTLTSSGAAPSMTSSNTGSICSGATVSIPLTASVASTYTWIAADNPNTTGESTIAQSTSTLSNTLINTTSTPQIVAYTVTPTAGACAGAPQTVNVTVNPTPAVTPSSSNVISCSTPTATLTGTSVGNTMVWNGGALSNASNPATVSAAGTYTVTATDPSTSCTNTATVVVTGNTTVPIISATSNHNLNCTFSTATLTGTSAGNTIVWNGGLLVNAANPATVNTAGTYTVTATNASNACTATTTVTVTSNSSIPDITAGSPLALNCSTTSGIISASSTVGGINYSWTGPGIVSGNSSSSATVNSAGTYTVTITDPANTCTNTTTVTVTSSGSLPNVIPGSSLTLDCITTSGTLSASSSTSGVSYAWTGPGIVSNGNTSSPTVNATGTYTVTVTDPSNSCTNTSTVVVTTNGVLPTVTTGSPLSLTCTILTGTITASSTTPGATFLWTGSGITANATTSSPTVNAAGTYTVTVSDPSNGCTNTGTVAVNTNTTPPNAVAGASLVLNCSTTSGLISVSSSTLGVSFSWAGPSVVSGATTASPTVNTAGSYTVTVTDPLNGCTNTTTVIVTNTGALPNVISGSPLVLNCLNTSGIITASSSTSGVTYNWSGPSITTGASTASPTVNAAGTYTVTVTNPSNGCSNTATVSVTNTSQLPNLTVGSSLALNCIVSSGLITASSTTSGVTYAWTGPGIVSGSSTSAVTVNGAGTYTVVVTDPSNGCTSTATTTVTQNTTVPNVSSIPTLALACTSGAVGIVTATSTTAGVSYNWQGIGIVSGDTTSSVTVDGAGTYIVTVTDPTNGCTASSTTIVSQVLAPTASVSNDVTITIGNSALLAAGGGGSYLWSTNDTTSTISVSPTETTTYCVTVSNASGCFDTACVRVTVEIPCPENKDLAVPNAFSPNGDYHNDRFCLQGWSTCIADFQIIIYDRWGEKVFESSDASFCWDGTYKGKDLDPAVFVYYITAVLSNSNNVEKKGNISLIR